MGKTIDRRGFVKSLAGIGAAGVIGVSAPAAFPQTQTATPQRAPNGLPARGDFVIRNAHILTMDPALGDIPNGDIHIKNGVIVAVGKALGAPGAAVLDARKMIVLPGLVDTHWHMWTTYLRCMAGDKTEDGYFPVTTVYGQAMLPEDMYRSTRLAAAEAIYSGITTVNDECHNVRSVEYAIADLRALKESGLRARFSYGPFRGMPAAQPRDMSGVEQLHRDWTQYSNGGLLTLGFTWGGVPADPATPERVADARKQIETARRLGLPISMHLASRENTPPGQVEAQAKYLGKDVLLIHMLATTPAEMKMVADAGSSISSSPGSELRIGYGLTKASEFMDAGINVCVSVDTVPLTGNAHLFGILKLLRNAVNAKAFNEFKLPARRALEMGTINGARALGIDHLVGSLTPGKRADLIMVQTNLVTMGVFTDPVHMIIEATEPSNVDTVVIDGRILKLGGKLTAMMPEKVIADASASLREVGKRLKPA